jgi:3-oxoacyl-[acyl-carrier protein] reductase
LSCQETAASPAALNDPADQPRVAIVTGGSRRICRETVSRLAADGFAVVVGYAGNRDLAEPAVTEITAAGGRAIAGQAASARVPSRRSR